jgi:hypothetical protein
MRFTGRMAPENNRAGKHNTGRASVRAIARHVAAG